MMGCLTHRPDLQKEERVMFRTGMTCLLIAVAIPWIVTSQTGCAQGADGAEKTADQIAVDYLEAIGGLEAHLKHTTRRTEGMFTFVAANLPPWKMAFTQKAPNLSHTRIDIPGHGAFIEVCDGTVVWRNEPGKPTQQLQGWELKQKLRDAHFHGYVDLKSDYASMTYGGQEEIEGKVHDLLNCTFEDGDRETLYLDATTHLLARIKRPGPKITVEFADYMEVDGTPVASTVTVLHQAKTVVKLKIETVTHGVEVDDALFARPERGVRGAAGGGGRGRGGGRRFSEGGTALHVQPLVHTLDTDGSVMIDEKELEAGFLKMLDQHGENHVRLLKLFDGDGDGALGKKEAQAAREFLFGLSGVLLYDANQDWQVDDEEADKAWDQWGEGFERYNDGVLKRFDRNKDGELNAEETKAGREQLKRRR
jgi:hypothetical protein